MPKRLLKNVTVLFLSLVDKGANKKRIIWKEQSSSLSPQFEKSIDIMKVDEEKRLVYGIVYSPDEEDTHGDTMTADEIEKASQKFMKARRTDKVDQQHDFDPNEGFVAENWITKSGDPVFPFDPPGSWAVAIKVENDETWQRVKDGEITGISMGGFANVEDIEKGETIDISKPYPNEHACRIRDPKDFQADSFRRITQNTDQGKLSIIVGKLKGKTSTTTQAFRFPKDEWTVAAARAHCEKHNGTFEAAKVEKSEENFMDKFKEIFSKIFKGGQAADIYKDFADEFNRNTINSAVWALQDALNKIMQDEQITDKQSAIKESINQFTTFIDNLGGSTMQKQFEELVASAKELVTKADEKKDQALIDSSKAFLEKVEKKDPEKVTEENFNEFRTEFDSLSEKVEKVEEPGAGSKEPGDKLDEILQEVKNISDRVEKLEKAHGGSRQALGQDDKGNGTPEKKYKGLPII